jgi:hypothetical protein
VATGEVMQTMEKIREALNNCEEFANAAVRASDSGEREAFQRLAEAYRNIAELLLTHNCHQQSDETDEEANRMYR